MTHSELRDVVHLVGGAVGSSSWPSDQHLHDQVDDVAPLEPAITRLFWGLNRQQCVIIIIIMQERERGWGFTLYTALCIPLTGPQCLSVSPCVYSSNILP